MIGQQGVETTTLDPQHNVLMRMVDWVENGNAPETVTGTKYVNVGLFRIFSPCNSSSTRIVRFSSTIDLRRSDLLQPSS